MNWKGGGCQWVGATGSDEVGMSVDTGGGGIPNLEIGTPGIAG